MERSKFNVDKDREKRTFGGIIFDSVMEMKYYRDVVCPKVESGEITKYELQKPYELQPEFTYNGKTVRSIKYVADFYIQYADGKEEVIDIKGCPDNTAKLKRKLFWYKYPNIQYLWVTYVKKYGGWILYDECKRMRREAVKAKRIKGGETDGKET